jgi:cation:H+ antiporter
MTSVVATLKGQRDIAIGNVVGSNIFNILCVLGLSGLVSPEPLLANMQMASLDMPVMLTVALLCLPLFFVGASLSRLEGGLFLVLYAAYVWYLIALTLNLGYLSDLRTGIIFVLVPLVAVYVTTLLGVDLRRRLR